MSAAPAHHPARSRFAGLAVARTSVLVCAGLLLAAAAARAEPPVVGETPTTGRNAAGLLAEVVLPPFGFDDPYSWMVGSGAFYERRLGASGALVLGGRLAVYGQHAMEPLFGRSTTLLAGPSVGWEIVRRARADVTLSIVPYLGAVQYWRRFEYDGEEYRASRTIMVLGVNVDLLLGARMMCGIASEPLLILDRTPVVALGQIQRLAWRF